MNGHVIRLGRLLWLSVWRSSVMWWSLRSFLITLVVGQTVTPLLGLLVWMSALNADRTVATYYLVLLLVQLMTVSYEHHTVSNEIYEGTFDQTMVEPKPVVLSYLGQNLAMRFWHLTFGLPVVVVIAVIVGVRLELTAVLAAVPAIVLAGALRFVFTYSLALSALWTQRAHGAVGVGETLIFLLGGTAAPLSFLPEPFQSAGQLLPFWAMLGMPAEIAAGTLQGGELFLAYATQLGWLLLFTLLCTAIWRRGVRRFTFFGG
ncbi:hypothetical protein GCM10009733_040220 [Nonomuraea maheshkhaliensis]|uniref:ABC transporter permease n=1 Tax=Nonomuraea maheshkhaliensis TaxID=419590 RepID=A0ABN2FCU9_9ACTN